MRIAVLIDIGLGAAVGLIAAAVIAITGGREWELSLTLGILAVLLRGAMASLGKPRSWRSALLVLGHVVLVIVVGVVSLIGGVLAALLPNFGP